jgi:hypothetical protein
MLCDAVVRDCFVCLELFMCLFGCVLGFGVSVFLRLAS